MRETTLLRELGPIERRRAIEAALVAMMSRPQASRPFVILEHRPSRRFVQFCGSTNEPLTFDVPALDKTVRLGGPDSPADVYESAAALALTTLGRLVYRSLTPIIGDASFVSGIEHSPHLVLIASFDEQGEVRAS